MRETGDASERILTASHRLRSHADGLRSAIGGFLGELRNVSDS